MSLKTFHNKQGTKQLLRPIKVGCLLHNVKWPVILIQHSEARHKNLNLFTWLEFCVFIVAKNIKILPFFVFCLSYRTDISSLLGRTAIDMTSSEATSSYLSSSVAWSRNTCHIYTNIQLQSKGQTHCYSLSCLTCSRI